MDIETIRVLAELPTIAILIYLLVRSQGQNEKLLAGLIESERNHAKNLVEIICSGKITVIDNTNNRTGIAILEETKN